VKVKVERMDRARMMRFKVKAESVRGRAGNARTGWKKVLLGRRKSMRLAGEDALLY